MYINNNITGVIIILSSVIISCSGTSSIVYLSDSTNGSLRDPSSISQIGSMDTDAKINGSHGELSGLYLTTDRTQMNGVPGDSVTLSVNESITVYARGMDDRGKWFELSDDAAITWKADNELEVTPTAGPEVKVKVVKKAVVSYATATVLTKEGQKIKEEFAVQIK